MCGVQVVDLAADVGDERAAGAEAVTVDAADEPAAEREKAVQLRGRVVEAARARPSVRAAEDRGVAEALAYTADLGRDESCCALPVDPHERLASAQLRSCARPLLEPAAPHAGSRDPKGRHPRVELIESVGCGVRIAGVGLEARRLSLLGHLVLVHAPVRGAVAQLAHPACSDPVLRSGGSRCLRTIIDAGGGTVPTIR